MTHAPEGCDRLLGDSARNEPYAEVTQYAIGVEHGRPVDLSKRMAQWCEMGRIPYSQERGDREPLLDRWSQPLARSMDEKRADAH